MVLRIKTYDDTIAPVKPPEYAINPSKPRPLKRIAPAPERFERIFNLACALESSGQVQEAALWCESLFSLAGNDVESARAYCLWAQLNELQGKWEDTLEAVCTGLSILGTPLPVNKDHIAQQLQEYIKRTTHTLNHRSMESLLSLPKVTSDKHEVTMELLYRAIPSAVQINPPLFVLADLMLFDMTVKHGTTKVSCKNFVDCGIIMGSMLQQYDKGYEFGRAAYQLLKRHDANELLCAVEFVFATYISHWKEHFSSSIACFERATIAGLETGDLTHTSYTFVHCNLRKLFTGETLQDCEAHNRRITQFLRNANTHNQTALPEIAHRVITELKSRCDAIAHKRLKDDHVFIARVESSNNAVDIGLLGQMIAWIAYLDEDYRTALYWSRRTLPYVYALEGMFHLPDYFLVYTLSILKCLQDDAGLSIIDFDAHNALALNLSRLRDWACLCPDNFAHKYHLAHAEYKRFENAKAKSIDESYQAALDTIAPSDFSYQRAAILTHRATHMKHQGDIANAKRNYQNAISLYMKWGARFKAERLQSDLDAL
ncbi:MAG: hypothetical protein JXR76_04615 [Deltaproteobacteria bacterium]|nr:hypothetical protein [Deltaproteobacteria bacterium]